MSLGNDETFVHFLCAQKMNQKMQPGTKSRYNKKKCFVLQKDSRFLPENSFLKLKDTKHLFLLFGFCLWALKTMDASQVHRLEKRSSVSA